MLHAADSSALAGDFRSRDGLGNNMKSSKTVFACQNVARSRPKWMGRCADCGAGTPRRGTRGRTVDVGGRDQSLLRSSAAGSAKLRRRGACRRCASRPASTRFDRVLGAASFPVRSCCWRRARHRQVNAAPAGRRAFRPQRRPGAPMPPARNRAPDQKPGRSARCRRSPLSISLRNLH